MTLVIVLAGAAFAANNDTLYVTAKVKVIDPVFLIYGGKTAEVGNYQATIQLGYTVE